MRVSHEHHIVLAASDQLAYATAAAAVILALSYVGLFVTAVISIFGSALSGGRKLLWAVFAFIAPFIGSALWFLLRRRDSRRKLVTS